MNTTKLSSKYQIVVPKAVRLKMKLKAGMNVTMYSLDSERAIILKKPQDYVQALKGLGQDAWQALGGADAYIKRERSSWDK